MGASPHHQPGNPAIMDFATPPSQGERRTKAAQLLQAVIDETLEPRMAINRWPESPDQSDPSLACAYLALWHFEADEVQQKTELFYMDAQLELLQQIANHLKSGKNLPPHILRTYQPESPVRFFYSRNPWADCQHMLMKFWRQALDIFQQAIQLIIPPSH